MYFFFFIFDARGVLVIYNIILIRFKILLLKRPIAQIYALAALQFYFILYLAQENEAMTVFSIKYLARARSDTALA